MEIYKEIRGAEDDEAEKGEWIEKEEEAENFFEQTCEKEATVKMVGMERNGEVEEEEDERKMAKAKARVKMNKTKIQSIKTVGRERKEKKRT